MKEPRVLRYDPADMPIITVAVSNALGFALSTRDLTTAATRSCASAWKRYAAWALSRALWAA
ncbi:MAG: Acriflavin resistance protein [uncultured Caballeronia sp.]|nr:MAG: Acriflavin resistance protein [uncultured Caballeronia sp.]